MTFAEMTMEEKNKFSHRKKAADQLVSFQKTRAPDIRQSVVIINSFL